MPFSADCATTTANRCNQGTSKYLLLVIYVEEQKGKRAREGKRGKERERERVYVHTSDSQGTLDVNLKPTFSFAGELKA